MREHHPHAQYGINWFALFSLVLFQIGCENKSDKQLSKLNELRHSLLANSSDVSAWNQLIEGSSAAHYGEATHYLVTLGEVVPYVSADRRQQAMELFFVKITDSESSIRRGAALGVLNASNHNTTEYLPQIAAIINKSSNDDATWFLIEAVGKHGKAALPHVDDIGAYFLKYLDQDDAFNAVRSSAKTLSRIGGRKSIAYLQKGMISSNDRIANYCKKMIGESNQ